MILREMLAHAGDYRKPGLDGAMRLMLAEQDEPDLSNLPRGRWLGVVPPILGHDISRYGQRYRRPPCLQEVGLWSFEALASDLNLVTQPPDELLGFLIEGQKVTPMFGLLVDLLGRLAAHDGHGEFCRSIQFPIGFSFRAIPQRFDSVAVFLRPRVQAGKANGATHFEWNP